MNGIDTILTAVRERGPEGDYRDLGDIRTERNGELLIFNYTNKAQYARRWNASERVSRGLIIDAVHCTVVARAFDKFFNLGEMDDLSLTRLPDGDVEITEKMDGSLGIIYHYQGAWHVATRGSFKSDQAQWAQRYLDAHYDTALWAPNITLLVEIIYPDNRIVLDYAGRAELVLIGARNRYTGLDYDHEDLQFINEAMKLPLVPRTDATTIEMLHAQAQTVSGIEGWVARFADGTRVKIKTNEYLRFHRAIFGLTPERVREAMLIDWNGFIVGLPEEFQPEIAAMATKIDAWIMDEKQRLIEVFSSLAPLALESRKAYALAVNHDHAADRPYLFALLDNREIEQMLLKNAPLDRILPAARAAAPEGGENARL